MSFSRLLAIAVAVALITTLPSTPACAASRGGQFRTRRDYNREELEQLLLSKERELQRLATSVKSLYNQSKCGAFSENCQCASSACLSPLQDPECSSNFGGCHPNWSNRKLSFTTSSVRTAGPVTSSTSQAQTLSSDDQTAARDEMCWTAGLDATFVQAYNADREGLRWQYFGAPSSFYRIYPGVPQEVCYDYDTRMRPWYVAATAGPRDLVLVIDTSGSMDKNSRLPTAIEAAKSILDALTIADSVAVVAFGSTARRLCTDGGSSCGPVQATKKNIASLTSLVDGLSASGSTNFEDAFAKAFGVLTSASEFTSNCHRVILFLADGSPTSGDSSTSGILSGIESGQQQLSGGGNNPAYIFTYSFGSDGSSSDELMKSIACNNMGIWAPVSDTSSSALRSQMGGYYELFATLRAESDTETVTWVEPYEDASGAGMMTTASLAIYDHTVAPPKLVGVVGVDLLTKDIAAVSEDYEGFLAQITQRSSPCPAVDTTSAAYRCQLHLLRKKELVMSSSFATTSNADRTCPNAPSGCVAPVPQCTNSSGSGSSSVNGLSSPYCDAQDSDSAQSTKSTYAARACDNCSVEGLSGSAIAGIVFGSIIGVAVAAVCCSFCVKNCCGSGDRRGRRRSVARGGGASSGDNTIVVDRTNTTVYRVATAPTHASHPPSAPSAPSATSVDAARTVTPPPSYNTLMRHSSTTSI